MSLVGLVNLAERLLNQNPAQGQDTQTGQKSASPQSTHGSQGAEEDQFTPSTQNGQAQVSAQDAGLFSVTQFSFFSAAADFLLGRSAAAPTNLTAPTAGTPPTANANPAAPQTTNGDSLGTQTAFVPAPSASALAALAQPAPHASSGANAADTLNAQTAAATALATPAPTASATTGSSTVQQQLQTLNQALAALGLSPQDIQQLDRIASVIKDFNPQAYTALVYQLEELAQQNSTTSSATTGGSAQPAASNSDATGTNAPAANGATAKSGGFQVQELVIKFSGVEAQGTVQSNGNGSTNGTGNGNFQVSAFNLQVEEVNLTLTNGNGQTAQIQAPVQNAATTNPNANQAARSPKAQSANA